MTRQLNDLEQRVVAHAHSLGLTLTVPPTLRPGYRVLIVGESAGEEEEREGEGFVGRAGELLWKTMNAAGWTRQDVSITNVVKRRPQRGFHEDFTEQVMVEVGRTKKGAVKAKSVRQMTPELGHWQAVLAEEIALLQPAVVITVGEPAMNALTPWHGITNWQGSRFDAGPYTVVPILHPAGILRGQQWQDVYLTTRILERVRKHTWPQQPDCQMATDPALEAALAFLWRCWTAERWCIDVETRGSHVVCFSVAAKWPDDTWGACCIPTARTDAVNAKWSWDENKRVWDAVGALYRHNPRVVNHALCAFDSEWLDFYGITITEHYMDTLHAFHLLYPELPKGLDDCIRFYGLGNYHKGMVNHTARSLKNEVLWAYNNLDSVRTLQLSYALESELNARGLAARYRDERRAVAVLGLSVQRAGYHLDEAAEAELKAIVQKARDETQARLDGQYVASITNGMPQDGLAPLIKTLNVNSPAQVQAYLYDTLKLPKQYKRADSKGKRSLTADDETLEKLVIKYPQHTALKRIQNIRHFRKIEGSYLSMQRQNGWATSTVNIAGTESFRWSMGVSARGLGVNAQTFPTVTRVMIVPPPGRIFVSPDLSQVEARYVAHFAGCRSQIQMFGDPKRSFHLENARRIFGREVTKKEPAYVDAKRVGHGGNYKLGPGRLSLMLGKPLAEARRLLLQYHKQYPSIAQWHDQVREEVLRKGFLVNPLGYRRDFFDALGCRLANGTLTEHQWKEAIAWLPQSLPSEIINRVMLRLQREFPQVWFHAHVHDAFLASIPAEAQADFIPLVLQAFAETFVVIREQPVLVPVECKVGYAWGFMQEWHGAPLTRAQWGAHLAEEKVDYERQVLADILQVHPSELDKELGL